MFNKKIITIFTILLIVLILFIGVIFSQIEIITALRCGIQNKELIYQGMLQTPVCVSVYSDGSKTCSSSDQCQSGFCIKCKNGEKNHCRRLGKEYPLCFDGEITVEDNSGSVAICD